MFGFSKTKKFQFDINLTSVEDSNFFLRALWSLFRKEPSFKSHPASSKDGQKKIVTIATIGLGINPWSGVIIHYKTRGCIQSIEFYNFPVDYVELLCTAVAQSLELTRDNKKINYSLAYKFKINYGRVYDYLFDRFTIYTDDEGIQNLVFDVQGIDLEDAKTFNKAKADAIINLFALSLTVPFTYITSNEVIPVKSDRVKKNVFRDKEISLREMHSPFQIDESDFFTMNYYVNNYDSPEIRELNSPIQMFHDGLKIERSSNSIGLQNNLETCHTLYLSAIEVLASLADKSTETCKVCSQERFKISSKIYKLISHTSKSISLGKMLREEYERRSKFLHTGKYFSTNNFIAHHIPQLSASAVTGNLDQLIPDDRLEYLHEIINSLIYKRIQFLSTKNSQNTAPSSSRQ